jgi:hypothetical protein
MGQLIFYNLSGEYIPTLNNALGSCSNPLLNIAYYSQVGKIITVTIAGFIDFDFSLGGGGSFEFTKPIISLNSAFGVCTTNLKRNINCYVDANTIYCESNDPLLIAANQSFYAIFQYIL